MAGQADPLMTALLGAGKDLLKFKIIQSISTGDKTYDSLLQTFMLSVMTAVFGWFSLDYFKTKWMIWRYRRTGVFVGGGTLTPENAKHWMTISKTREDRLVFKTWLISDATKQFTQKFCSYFIQKVGWKLGKKRVAVFDTDGFDDVAMMSKSKILTSICWCIGKTDYMPLFVLDDSVAGCFVNDDSALILYSDDPKTLRAMLEDINKCVIDHKQVAADNEVTKNGGLMIYNHHNDEEYVLYRDRCMDKFVSRHKPRIKNLLDGFVKANKQGSDYGGFGTYNLGFMLHGKPGTGKTFLIKAICNYLGRNAEIVDMRKINTKAKFEEIFYGHSLSQTVYVLDEFDCVQGAIKDRAGTDEKESDSSKTNDDVLQRRKMELLKLLMQEKAVAKSDKTDAVATSPVQEELDKINREISDRENSLSLDTMLTVLDGMVEMRGRVIIATTNFIDNIDKALMRDGRFDMKVKLDTFNSDEVRELLKIMFVDTATPEELVRLDTIKLAEDVYTPTQLINMGISQGSLCKVLDIVKMP